MAGTPRLTWLYLAFSFVVIVALGACGSPTEETAAGATAPAVDTGAAGEKTFTSARYGIRITYPADLELRRTFKRSYLASGNWKTYAGPDAPQGEPVVALVLPGSNSVTAGELRIGASRQPDAVQSCTQPSAAMVRGSKGEVTIYGVPFTTFKARDAAMSHYLVVHSFRGVHDETCYAVDVLVFGTNPQVYDPPATPPFTREQAFARLLPVVDNLQFTVRSSAPAPSVAIPATYQGLLPCADCPGIEYQLNLLADHRYVLRMVYRDRNAHFEQRGHWRLGSAGKVLTLQSQKSSPQQWAVRDDGRRLRKLDGEGHVIRSGLNYDLTRSAKFKPLGPGVR